MVAGSNLLSGHNSFYLFIYRTSRVHKSVQVKKMILDLISADSNWLLLAVCEDLNLNL